MSAKHSGFVDEYAQNQSKEIVKLKNENKRLTRALEQILEIKRSLPTSTKSESAQMAEVASEALKCKDNKIKF